MACDHMDGSRSYEGLWGRRSVRFCPDSHMPTRAEHLADEFAGIVQSVEPPTHFHLAGGPDLPTLVTEVLDPPV